MKTHLFWENFGTIAAIIIVIAIFTIIISVFTAVAFWALRFFIEEFQEFSNLIGWL